jgi:hypothetical protein
MVVDQRHVPVALPPGKDPVSIVQEAGWAPGPVCTGAENLAPTKIRCPVGQAIPAHIVVAIDSAFEQNLLRAQGRCLSILQAGCYFCVPQQNSTVVFVTSLMCPIFEV